MSDKPKFSSSVNVWVANFKSVDEKSGLKSSVAHEASFEEYKDIDQDTHKKMKKKLPIWV